MTELDFNPYGRLKVPGLNISLELLFLILYPTFLIPSVFFLFAYRRKSKSALNTPAGCTKLGIRTLSHMTDEYDGKYDHGTTDQNQWRVKALYIHPIKSCAAVELDELEIEAAGPIWDRKFCFAEWLAPTVTKAGATEEDRRPQWTFRTLRQNGYEKLALVKPEVWVPKPSQSVEKSALRHTERYGALVIKYPNVPSGPLAFLDRLMIRWGMLSSENSFSVPLLVPDDHKYPKEVIKIWSDSPTYLNYGRHVPDDFRIFLGARNPVALFRADPEAYREVYRCAPSADALGYQSVVACADSYAANLLNLASVHHVGNKIRDSIPRFSARRFRGNLILTGPKAYDEDDWKRIRISSPSSSDDADQRASEIYCVCRCVRCRLPNVDPDTAERHPSEPDKTLRSFRCIDEGDPKGACMGMQLVPASSKGMVIKVGDRVEVLERGEHFYINKRDGGKPKR